MANHPSALKRHRQSLKRRQRNRDAKATIRTSVKKVAQLLAAGDKEAAAAQIKITTRLFDKAAVHGILHKKSAARSISRLHQRANSVLS